MATAYIEYLPSPVDAPLDCKPTHNPTVLFQFSVCQHCDKVYIAERNTDPMDIFNDFEWVRVLKFSQGARMYKRAKKHARQ